MTGTRKRRAVVLGASGFIGLNLSQALSNEGYDVVCFSRTASPHWSPDWKIILGELADPPEELVKLMRGALVFHLVSTTRPAAHTAGVTDEITANIMPTVRLLEMTREAGCRWVFASSGGTVYGDTSAELISEHHPTRPISSYGVMKLALEGYFSVYKTLHGMGFIVLRLANPYGAYQSAAKGQGLVAALVERILSDKPIHVWGDGGNVRDYIYIDDATGAMIAAAERGRSGEIYNIGSGKGTSIVELIEAVADEVGKRPLIIYEPPRGVDVRRNVLDTSKLRAATGWEPKSSLREGISATFRAASRNNGLSEPSLRPKGRAWK